MPDTIDQIRHAYKTNPDAKISLYIEAAKTLEPTLQQLSRAPPENFEIDSLDTHHSKRELALIIGQLPPEVIKEEFGKYAYLWTIINYPDQNKRKAILEQSLAKTTGHDRKLLAKAQITQQQLNNINALSTILPTYQLIATLKNSLEQYTGLENALKECANIGVEISDKRARDYTLSSASTVDGQAIGYEQTWGFKKDNGKRYDFYLDSPTGISLHYKREPNAVIAFLPKAKDILTINQIQGLKVTKDHGTPHETKTHSRGLAPIDWRKLMITITEQIATQYGFTTLCIQTGRKNRWATEEWGTPKLDTNTAVQKYDAVAERLGFKQGIDDNWYRKIETQYDGKR